MRNCLAATAVVLASLFGSGVSHANDSTAAIGAGGIIYTTSSKIRIERESLYISEQEVRVAYDFPERRRERHFHTCRLSAA